MPPKRAFIENDNETQFLSEQKLKKQRCGKREGERPEWQLATHLDTLFVFDRVHARELADADQENARDQDKARKEAQAYQARRKQTLFFKDVAACINTVFQCEVAHIVYEYALGCTRDQFALLFWALPSCLFNERAWGRDRVTKTLVSLWNTAMSKPMADMVPDADDDCVDGVLSVARYYAGHLDATKTKKRPTRKQSNTKQEAISVQTHTVVETDVVQVDGVVRREWVPLEGKKEPVRAVSTQLIARALLLNILANWYAYTKYTNFCKNARLVHGRHRCDSIKCRANAAETWAEATTSQLAFAHWDPEFRTLDFGQQLDRFSFLFRKFHGLENVHACSPDKFDISDLANGTMAMKARVSAMYTLFYRLVPRTAARAYAYQWNTDKNNRRAPRPMTEPEAAKVLAIIEQKLGESELLLLSEVANALRLEFASERLHEKIGVSEAVGSQDKDLPPWTSLLSCLNALDVE